MTSPRVSSILQEMIEEWSEVNVCDLPTVLGSQSADKSYEDASFGGEPGTASGHDPTVTTHTSSIETTAEQHGDATSNDFIYTILEGLPSHLRKKVLNSLGKRNTDEDIVEQPSPKQRWLAEDNEAGIAEILHCKANMLVNVVLDEHDIDSICPVVVAPQLEHEPSHVVDFDRDVYFRPNLDGETSKKLRYHSKSSIRNRCSRLECLGIALRALNTSLFRRGKKMRSSSATIRSKQIFFFIFMDDSTQALCCCRCPCSSSG